MSVLARLSGVPAATIKHYLREGLLPPPARKTGRNMAFYDPSLVDRIRKIKRLQREHFLPLRVIKELLEGNQPENLDNVAAAAITRALQDASPASTLSEPQLLEMGVRSSDLRLLEQLGAIDSSGEYSPDDVRLLRTLGAARKAGLTEDMLPPEILQEYLAALRALVRTELALFRRGVVPKAGDALPDLTRAATHLSEELVLTLRRKLLLPTLRELIQESLEKSGPT